MCDYKVLAHNSDGYVILCHSCGHFQLAFGTSMVTFEPAEFTAFCGEAGSLKASVGRDGFNYQKRISLNLPCSCSRMILNYGEFLKLCDLAGEALFNCEVELLMNELNINPE